MESCMSCKLPVTVARARQASTIITLNVAVQVNLGEMSILPDLSPTSMSLSAEEYPHLEQDTDDPTNEGGLPTYDDLAAQNGPNSRWIYYRLVTYSINTGARFGRWRGWIEKR